MAPSLRDEQWPLARRRTTSHASCGRRTRKGSTWHDSTCTLRRGCQKHPRLLVGLARAPRSEHGPFDCTGSSSAHGRGEPHGNASAAACVRGTGWPMSARGPRVAGASPRAANEMGLPAAPGGGGVLSSPTGPCGRCARLSLRGGPDTSRAGSGGGGPAAPAGTEHDVMVLGPRGRVRASHARAGCGGVASFDKA